MSAVPFANAVGITISGSCKPQIDYFDHKRLLGGSA